MDNKQLSGVFKNDNTTITDSLYKLYPYLLKGWSSAYNYASEKRPLPEGLLKASLGTILGAVNELKDDERTTAWLAFNTGNPKYAERAGSYAFEKYLKNYLDSSYDQIESGRVKGLITGEQHKKNEYRQAYQKTLNDLKNEISYLWSKYSPPSLAEQGDIAITNFLRDIFKKR